MRCMYTVMAQLIGNRGRVNNPQMMKYPEIEADEVLDA